MIKGALARRVGRKKAHTVVSRRGRTWRASYSNPAAAVLVSSLSPLLRASPAFFWLVLLSVRLCGAPIPKNPTKNCRLSRCSCVCGGRAGAGSLRREWHHHQIGGGGETLGKKEKKQWLPRSSVPTFSHRPFHPPYPRTGIASTPGQAYCNCACLSGGPGRVWWLLHLSS